MEMDNRISNMDDIQESLYDYDQERRIVFCLSKDVPPEPEALVQKCLSFIKGQSETGKFDRGDYNYSRIDEQDFDSEAAEAALRANGYIPRIYDFVRDAPGGRSYWNVYLCKSKEIHEPPFKVPCRYVFDYMFNCRRPDSEFMEFLWMIWCRRKSENCSCWHGEHCLDKGYYFPLHRMLWMVTGEEQFINFITHSGQSVLLIKRGRMERVRIY